MGKAETLIRKLLESKRTLALAESCTAGLASDLLARIPGASKALWGSFVCYTKEAKVSMLGLDQKRLEAQGLVSAETAADMVSGALAKSGASAAVAVTGLAGPSGDESGLPVGTVWIAAALQSRAGIDAREFHFRGGRNKVRLRAAWAVLETALELLTETP